MHETVTSRLEQEDIEYLDKLIKMGHFSNRSEAIRIIVSKELKEIMKKQFNKKIQEELEKKSLLKNEKLIEYAKILFPSSVADVVAEGRTR